MVALNPEARCANDPFAAETPMEVARGLGDLPNAVNQHPLLKRRFNLQAAYCLEQNLNLRESPCRGRRFDIWLVVGWLRNDWHSRASSLAVRRPIWGWLDTDQPAALLKFRKVNLPRPLNTLEPGPDTESPGYRIVPHRSWNYRLELIPRERGSQLGGSGC